LTYSPMPPIPNTSHGRDSNTDSIKKKNWSLPVLKTVETKKNCLIFS
jgi:hypothetical protein